MSTVFAVVRSDGEAVDRGYVERCCQVSADAGPDRRGVWVAPRPSARVGLAHGLLATTDDARRERQPAEIDGVWICADARIDNRDELAAALTAAGETLAADATDDEYIARAYRAWGADALSRLEGDFAFVLWDASRGELFAARDCFGLRPLFYTADRHRVIVASEIRQLFVDGTVSRDLDGEVVSDYLHAAHRSDAGRSFYRDVHQVRPGHVLRVANGVVEQRRFWQWRDPTPIRYRSRDDYAAHLAGLMRRAVGARMRTTAPVGLLLSGGLDSSAIAGFAVDVLRRRGHDAASLRTYSMVFDEHRDCDERRWIEPLTSFLGVDRHWLRPEPQRLFSRSPRVDEPDASTLAEPHWSDALADLQRAGGRVMLGGDGGETVFLGESNLHFVDWLARGRVRELVREARGYRAMWGEWPRVPWRAVAAAQVPAWLYRRLPPALSSGAPSWIDGSREVWKRRLRRRRAQRTPRVFRSYAHQFAFDSIVSDTGTGAGWWVPAAHNANRYGVAYSYPFMDRRLLEFVFAVPVEQFFEDGVDRAILRRALAGLIPDAVRLRTEPTTFDAWFGRVARGAEWSEVIEHTRWPDLPQFPTRARARAGEGRAWQRIALAQFVLWYDRGRTPV